VRIAVFFPASLFSAWCCSYGLVNTLKRMGHEVIGVPIDPQKQQYAPQVPEEGDFEAVILSGPEHLTRLQKVKWTVPTVAWMHETVEREDYGKLDVEMLKRSADLVFCPGIQDEKYGFRYLPFGVDTEIFHPEPNQPRTRDAGFIGLVYPKRQEFLAKLRPLLNATKFSVGNVQVLEVDGVNPRKTAELYAENLRSFKVFVNLPTLSQLAVTKIYEALACGTIVLTPKIEHIENLAGIPGFVYDGAEECAELVRSISKAGDCAIRPFADEIAQKHSLELRCQVLIDALKEIGAKASDGGRRAVEALVSAI
jgi:hypothetical protein